MLILILGFIVGFIWVVFSIAIPAFIPLFIRFSDNIKSIVGLLLCNVGTTAFLYLNFTIQLAICYAVPVFSGIFLLCIGDMLKFEKQQSLELLQKFNDKRKKPVHKRRIVQELAKLLF